MPAQIATATHALLSIFAEQKIEPSLKNLAILICIAIAAIFVVI